MLTLRNTDGKVSVFLLLHWGPNLQNIYHSDPYLMTFKGCFLNQAFIEEILSNCIQSKMGADESFEKPQMPQNLSAQRVCPSPKV